MLYLYNNIGSYSRINSVSFEEHFGFETKHFLLRQPRVSYHFSLIWGKKYLQ